MKGIMMVVLLIVALIIGILVIQDTQTEDQSGRKNIERVDQAKEAAATAEKALKSIKDTAKEAARPQPQPML
jgi:Tfp pilus assembly protein PilX